MSDLNYDVVNHVVWKAKNTIFSIMEASLKLFFGVSNGTKESQVVADRCGFFKIKYMTQKV